MMTQPLPASPELHLPPHPEGLGGLIALVEGRRQPLPLRSVTVRASIAGDCARVVVEQRFANPYHQPLAVTHLFPLPDEGAVTELVLQAGEVVVRGACMEKEEAKAAFERAAQQGHRAALLEAPRDDVHVLQVTRIPPGEEVTVRIVIVERLLKQDGWTRWRFPTVIPTRYMPGVATHHTGPGALPATDHVPDGDQLQPPLRLAGGVPLYLEVELSGPIRGLKCAQHAVSMALDDGGVRVSPAANASCDRDFVLAFHSADDDKIAARAWTDGAHTLVFVEPPAVAMPRALPREAVFVVDISGSMQGRKMEAAKRALIAALHGLMPGDRFRLIAFDDHVERFNPDGATPVSDHSVAAADAWVQALQPRGGTLMLPAIQAALASDPSSLPTRSVLFITDGQAWNEDELVAAVANRRGGARFFTLGIDTAVNSSLLRRLARVGGATCTLLTPSDDVEEAMAQVEARFGSPVLEQLQVDGFSDASLKAGCLFAGQAGSLLIEGSPSQLTLSANSASGPWRSAVSPRLVRFPIGALWGRARVAALQDRLTLKPFEAEALRGEILRVALSFSLASRFTSFVAVDPSRVVAGDMVDVTQPAEAPDSWGGVARGAAPGSAAPGGQPKGLRRRSAPRSQAGELMKQRTYSAPPPPAQASAPQPSSMAPLREESARSFAEAPMELEALAEEEESLDQEQAASAPMPPRTPAPSAKARPAAPLGASSPSGIGPGKGSAGGGKGRAAVTDPASALARSQSADGSFGGDVARTAAALLTLLLLGHTRRQGSRRRTALKAATWLAAQASPLAKLALSALAEAEAGQPPAPQASWAPLMGAGEEGAMLRALSEAPASS